MSEIETRKEILDLLSRGKISIDEAVKLLDQSQRENEGQPEEEPLYKAEMEHGFGEDAIVKIKADESDVVAKAAGEEVWSESKNSGRQPRWLRVQVADTKTGKNKVTVNVPFGMVKFGLGVARAFSPEMKGVDLDDIGAFFNEAESGLLVDVQDDESNEHVRVFFD